MIWPVSRNVIASTRVYVADASSNEIFVFALGADDAKLELVQRLALAAGVGPLTAAPDRPFLYAQLRGDTPTVATLAVDPETGTLRTLATTPVGALMAYLQIDRSGSHLFGASYAGDAFAIHTIDADGIVGESTQFTPTPPHAHYIVTDPTNRFLLVTSLGGDIMLQYAFDAGTGHATPIDPPFTAAVQGSGPRHVVFHPQADVVYVNGELDGSISVYGFDSRSGRLTEVQRVNVMPDDATAPPWGADLHISPDGRFVYASERRTSTLAIFGVRPQTGLLDRRAVVSTEAQPRSFALDPRGRHAFVGGEKSHYLAHYEIEAATGSLLRCERYPIGPKPAWVGVCPLPSATTA